MIVADILQIATEPVKSTYIQYRANLSFEQLSVYTRTLQQRGLIEKHKDKTWLITERGKEYLLVYSQLQRILDYVEPTTSSEEDNSSIRG